MTKPDQHARRPDWRALLSSFARQRPQDDLVPALFAATGATLGLLLGAGALVLASAPPPLLRPASGLALIARLALVVPLPALVGGHLGMQLGSALLRWLHDAR